MTLTAEGMGGRESGHNPGARSQDTGSVAAHSPSAQRNSQPSRGIAARETEGALPPESAAAAANPAQWIPPNPLPVWLLVAGEGFLYECGSVHYSEDLNLHGRIVGIVELQMTQADMDDFLDELRWAKEHEVPGV